MKINIGCGDEYRADSINIDLRKECNPDKVWDLNQGIPCKDNSVNEIYAKMILEHLDNPIFILKEIVRVCKDKAKVIIIVPHANSYLAVTDITHKSFYTENSFDVELMINYGVFGLRLINQEFLYPLNKWKRFIPFKNFFKIWFNGIYDDIKFEFEKEVLK